MSKEVKPFNVSISDAEVKRYYNKIRDARVPQQDIVPGAGTEYGFTTEWATDLYRLWSEKYDWREQEKIITQWDHFITELEGINIHFIHKRSKSPKAIPILLVHGWPGSFYEFSQVINPLSDENAPISFHCVVPSLPGFCWSSGPPKGWVLQDTARIFHALMKRLGYEKFCIQTGDW
jgi:pimeloyl-ACP methyl ester carboxylesterase